MEEPDLHGSLLCVHTEKTKSYLYQIVPRAVSGSTCSDPQNACPCSCLFLWRKWEAEQCCHGAGSMGCVGDFWHVTRCHLAGSAQERPREQGPALPCLCIKPFSCKYTNAEGTETWGLGSCSGCLPFGGVFIVAELKSKEFEADEHSEIFFCLSYDCLMSCFLKELKCSEPILLSNQTGF